MTTDHLCEKLKQATEATVELTLRQYPYMRKEVVVAVGAVQGILAALGLATEELCKQLLIDEMGIKEQSDDLLDVCMERNRLRDQLVEKEAHP